MIKKDNLESSDDDDRRTSHSFRGRSSRNQRRKDHSSDDDNDVRTSQQSSNSSKLVSMYYQNRIKCPKSKHEFKAEMVIQPVFNLYSDILFVLVIYKTIQLNIL